jgi:uncharacterized protein
MINWRKLNRILHRDLGYIFFGMTIIYSVSGIVMNHKTRMGDASIITKRKEFSIPTPIKKDSIDKEFVIELLEMVEEDAYKQFYFPTKNRLMVYLNRGHVSLNLITGKGQVIKTRNRPILYEFNFLHYNKPKKLWTWFSDIFAVSLIIVAITGLFMIRGKNGITFRGGILVLAGIIVPLLFLLLYLWTV